MQITDKLFKQIDETKYLSVENTKRYRPIIRFFYEEYEKINYMLYKEDVFNELIKNDEFKGYTLEQCESDLNALTEWKNLTAIQDTSTVNTIEEFKNRKFRYKLTDYAVEIERLVLKLENLGVEGTSLEPTLFERIKEDVMKINSVIDNDVSQISGWWDNLNTNFKKLNQNYQDYIKTFYDVKLEEIVKSTQFVIYKNDLIKYLRDFIKSLQENSYVIEDKLKNISEDTESKLLEKIYLAQSSVIRIDRIDKKEEDNVALRQINKEKWENFKKWFLGTNSKESEVLRIYGITNDIIRKITRYASQIVESKGNITSRKEDYRKLCELFCKSNTIEESHKLSSIVFGIASVNFFKSSEQRRTDSINSSILEEDPIEIELKPRIRIIRDKVSKEAIVNKSQQKSKLREEYLQKIKNEKELLDSYIKDNQIIIENLPEVTREVRITLLKWISKANQMPDKKIKTEDGRNLILEYPIPYKECTLRSEDGDFTMPAFKLKIY